MITNIAGTHFCAEIHENKIDLYVEPNSCDAVVALNMDAERVCEVAEHLIKIAMTIAPQSECRLFANSLIDILEAYRG